MKPQLLIITMGITACLVGCSTPQQPAAHVRPQDRPELKAYYAASNPDFWRENIGKSVTVKGVADHGKIGPYLQSEHGRVWMSGMGWPRELRGTVLQVTGTVVRGYEAKTLTKEQAQRVQHGSVDVGPVDEGPDYQQVYRSSGKPYLLKDVKYLSQKSQNREMEDPNKEGLDGRHAPPSQP